MNRNEVAENYMNTIIRMLYSPGYSALTMSLYKLNLTLSFAPFLKRENNNHDKYCFKSFQSTSIGHNEAAFLYLATLPIIDGKAYDKQIEAELSCNNNTRLIFEQKQEDGQMYSYLTIEKNNRTIPFLFPTRAVLACRDDKIVNVPFKIGLCVFNKTLNGYLTGIGMDKHLSKLPALVPNHEGDFKFRHTTFGGRVIN